MHRIAMLKFNISRINYFQVYVYSFRVRTIAKIQQICDKKSTK